MVTSSPYSNLLHPGYPALERQPTRRGADRPDPASRQGTGPSLSGYEPMEGRVSGDGSVVLYNTRLDVDVSVRLSDLLTRMANVIERLERLESIAGVSETPLPTNEIRLGIWRLIAKGTSLLKQVDINAGLTVEPVWDTKEENTL